MLLKYRVPKSGDAVVGGGRVVLYHQRRQRYEIQYSNSRQSCFLTRLEFELEQSALSSYSEQQQQQQHDTVLHLLVASHLQKERDLTLLLRGVQSLLQQTDPNFCVFLSISGSSLLEPATDVLQALLSQQQAGEWFLVPAQQQEDSNYSPDDTNTSFQHLKQLHTISRQVNSKAWILFLKQTDLYHPKRVEAFQKVLQDPMTEDRMPFALSKKLLVGELKSTGEGQLRDFIHSNADFSKWKTVPTLNRNVTLSQESDANEFFDYCVPSFTLTRFFKVTPFCILTNANCDLRLAAMLDDLADLEPLSQYPWLLIHYSCTRGRATTSIESTFNRHDWLTGVKILDDPTLSMQQIVEQLTDFDRHVSSTDYPALSPTQVALCRRHLESIMLRYCYWNEPVLEDFEIRVIRQIDMYHGRGLGKLVWKHCLEKVRSCFSTEEQWLNQTWSSDDEEVFTTTTTVGTISVQSPTNNNIISQFFLFIFHWIRSWVV